MVGVIPLCLLRESFFYLYQVVGPLKFSFTAMVNFFFSFLFFFYNAKPNKRVRVAGPGPEIPPAGLSFGRKASNQHRVESTDS